MLKGHRQAEGYAAEVLNSLWYTDVQAPPLGAAH